jgi:hypothetical protein
VLIDRQAHTDRGAEHDPAAVGHRGGRRLGGEQLSGHVGLKEAIEVGLGDGFQRSEVLDPGVADQQIQAAELGYHRADQLVGLRGLPAKLDVDVMALPIFSLSVFSGCEQSSAARPSIGAT